MTENLSGKNPEEEYEVRGSELAQIGHPIGGLTEEDSSCAGTEKAKKQTTQKAPPFKYWWKPGQSGNPSGRVPLLKELREAFRAQAPTALATLVECLTCKNNSVRVRAAEAIFMRGYGRGESIVPDDQETPPEDRAAVQYNWSLLTNDEWARFKELQTEVKVLVAKATVPVAVEGEAQKRSTA